MIRRMAIFGATGDLTPRYLLPALARLYETGRLPEGFEIYGLARDDWDTEAFQSFVEKQLAEHAADVATLARSGLVEMLEYHRADVTDPEQVAKALGSSQEPIVAYLALPPVVFAPTIEALAGIGLQEGSRIVVEKPFGEDLESARKLNRLLHEAFPEEAVFRADHFLGLQTVQNILGLRFANRIFEPVWNHDHVEGVEIVWDETLALEGRASYYDTAGALKDMIQNHLLQLLCLIAMEPPITLHEGDLRDRKADVLRAVRRLSPEEVGRQSVRARYTAGRSGDKEIPSYVEEEGIDPGRETETFAQVILTIDNWRWSGVPFVLRTGKALSRDRMEISVHFKPVPHPAFGQRTQPHPNVLRLRLDPDRIHLAANINGPGDPFDLEHIELGVELAPQDPPAYGRLLLGVLEGDPTLSIRADEAEESWRIVEPVLEAWTQGSVPLLEYPAGSGGPEEAAGIRVKYAIRGI
ncbi:MAG: glucose-6-phosphate dehydrogenase [Actinomycetota bacterium]|nr:glucose-6-phosphate dehydrogenase [Actinomycetota bacterium]